MFRPSIIDDDASTEDTRSQQSPQPSTDPPTNNSTNKPVFIDFNVESSEEQSDDKVKKMKSNASISIYIQKFLIQLT